MKHVHPTTSTMARALMAAVWIPAGSLMANVVFEESFESPVVTGYDDNTVPDNGNWIGSSGAFNATWRGLYSSLYSWPDTATFSTPYGDQGFYLNYSTTQLTTAVGATGQTVTAGETYTVTFNAAFEIGSSADYKVELVAFDVADDDAARANPNSPAGTVVASATGSLTASDMSDSFSLSFSPDGSNPHLGKDLGIRIDKATGSAIYDNIRLIVGHDYDPSPESGVITPSGTVSLSWTNHPPTSGSDVNVDVWFGTDPDPSNGSKVLDAGLNTTTVDVSAPVAGTYYWRIDSYLDGNPAGTPVSSTVFVFRVIDTDNDGLPDEYELANTFPQSSTSLDPAVDIEPDGLTTAQEYFYGTDPNVDDTDGDTLTDGDEINGTAGSRPATSPLLVDTDGDLLDDDIETNTGVWVDSFDTGTNPVDPDWDDDGLVDGVETNDGFYIDAFTTGSNPYNNDSDSDNVQDWYEVTASFTDPNNASEKPPLPYPLPDPDGSTGATDKPVKVYIMSGQSNMVGFGTVAGTGEGTLETMVKVQNKFPNLIDGSNNWTTRQDVRYRGVVSDIENAQLSPGNLGSTFGPELGFGYVMGYYHDEPVLLLKSSIGNRALGWDILPAGTPSWEYEGTVYAGYGEAPAKRAPGDPLDTNPGWWAGYEWDRFFLDDSEFVRPQGGPITNVVDVLDNFSTEYPDWAAQGFEIAGFVWWQGDKDRYDMGYATKYKDNLVTLIDSLRSYYTARYPGKVASNAPVVLATLGQTVLNETNTPAENEILNAQLAVDGDPTNFPGISGEFPAYAGNVKTVYANPLSAGGASNGHYNKNAVTYMMVGDALGTAMVELLETEVPPSPNPMTFEIPPAAVNTTTISMTATEGYSINGPVEYYFENVTAGTNSGWSTSRTWTEGGLTPGNTYTYQVKARDSNLLEGDFSATADATAEADTYGPLPDPMTFDTPPTAQGENAVTMTATTAFDVSGPVQYYFTCTAGPGNNSGWQSSATYTDTGLAHSTEYTYTVKTRDSLLNESAPSAGASATTTSPDTTAPTPDPMTFAALPTALGVDSISMTASEATDPAGVEYYFQCTTNASFDSGWQDATTYVASGLASGTEYTFVVRARDKSPLQNVTGDSAPAAATTETPDVTAPVISLLSPADEGTDIPVESDLSITFTDENDIAVGTGNITIKNLTDATQVVISVTDGAQVSVAGKVLTINPTADLLYEKVYAVQIDATAIDDTEGNSFAGIADDTTWNFTCESAPPPGLVFEDDFEVASGSPDVDAAGSTGNTSGQVNTAKWVRASTGFGGNRNGIVDESSGLFADPTGEQAYAFRYTNSGVTTAQGVIGQLTAGTVYTVNFKVVRDGTTPGTGLPYNAKLVTFASEANRTDCSQAGENGTSAVLASATGSASDDGLYTLVTFDYTATGGEGTIGQDLAVRFVGATNSAIIDDVQVITSIPVDNDPPLVDLLTPADDAIEVSANTNLVLDFNEAVTKGTGFITIKNLTDATQVQIDVTDAAVSIANDVVTIDPAADLLPSKDYAVQIDSTAIEDLGGNAYAGIADDTTWNFTTSNPDVTAPTIASLAPADDSLENPNYSNLVITFDEDVAVGTGFVTLKNLTDATQVQIDVTDGGLVSVAGSVVTIDPAADLVSEKDYAVQIDATAFEDLAGNPFAGIADDTTWKFGSEGPPSTGIVFSDNFEAGANSWGGNTPDVSTYNIGNTSKQANTTLWVKSSQGFGSDRAGLVDESENGGANFTDPAGEQAYTFRYTNSGVTTADGVIGALTAGTTYTVSFDVCVDGFNGGAAYSAALVTFNGDPRNDVRGGGAGTGATALIASTSGSAAGTAYERISFEYVSDGTEPTLGQDLALRFFGVTSSAIIDNVEVTAVGGGGGGGNNFSDWIANYPGVGSSTGFDDDPDGDTYGNGIESYFGTDPSAITVGTVAGQVSGGTFTFTHPVNDTPVDNVTAAYTWSSDLATFNADGASAGGTTVTFSQGATVNGIVEVTATVTGTPVDSIYVRVEVTQN